MRVLVTCVPQTGHILPVLPLAEAFDAQGDEVLVASGADAAEPVTARGLAFQPVGPPFAEWFAALAARTRGRPGDGLAPERVEAYFVPRLFGEIGTALVVDDLLAVARELRPDLLVFDPLLYAGPLVATVLGIRPVQHTVGPLTDAVVAELVTDAVSPIWRQFGFDVPPSAGMQAGTTVTICPAALDPAADRLPNIQPLRPVALPAQGRTPPDLPAHLWERPVVYLTMGTFSNANTGLFRLVLDALADLPLNVVATVGARNDPSALGPVPANACIARFIPQADLLAHCAGVVHHAGAGTAFGVLAHGLPAVALPQSADNFTIADRLATARVACVLMPHEVTAEAVREAVGTILDQPGHREAAQGLACDIAAMPSPAEVAAILRR